MVHDEMVTDEMGPPLIMQTPPPCKKEQHKHESPIGAMGTFEHERARTLLAEFPLMVDDEMATVPPKT